MSDPQPIAIPPKRLWHNVRKRWLPPLFFVATTALCVVLWRYQAQSPALIGEAEAASVTLSSPHNGVFAGFAPIAGRRLQAYDSVQAADRVAHLDAGQIAYELEQLLEKVHTLQSEAESGARRNVSSNPQSESEATAGQQATCPYLAEMDRCQSLASRIEVLQKELQLRQFEMRLENLRAQGDANTLDEPEMQRLDDERTQRAADIRQLRSQLKPNAERTLLGDDSATGQPVGPEERVLLGALRRRCDECLSRINAIETEARSLDVVSPIQGVISATYVEAGQVLQRGTRIATVVADRATHIVSYIPENEAIRPATGMRVIVRPRRIGAAGMPSVIEAIGPQVESIPTHQRRHPNVAAWGRPARIPIPDKLVIEPGALVDVILRVGS